ncbi:hypothetical protein BACCAP_00389 [Pseudoflavonifractor capillosus ATCC 29799]|uniref:Uncharacterized protein n=1 Tax=Pseudoflavonifractor capillosus ATCC 29799 TaxID=411467 RepID=A6NQB9_9FIRM|nr:hypothetical protein BACCAP_00389 [Pseudoflavonifractor capillosus ATCC 29799]
MNFPVLGRKRLTFGPIWDTIVLYAVTKTAMTEHEYQAIRRTEKDALG